MVLIHLWPHHQIHLVEVCLPFLGNQGQSEPEEDSFNIDDLVKKIDAKIAEIEKRRRTNKKEPEQVQKPVDVVSEPVTQSTEKENVSFNDLTQSNQKHTSTLKKKIILMKINYKICIQIIQMMMISLMISSVMTNIKPLISLLKVFNINTIII